MNKISNCFLIGFLLTSLVFCTAVFAVQTNVSWIYDDPPIDLAKFELVCTSVADNSTISTDIFVVTPPWSWTGDVTFPSVGENECIIRAVDLGGGVGIDSDICIADPKPAQVTINEIEVPDGSVRIEININP